MTAAARRGTITLAILLTPILGAGPAAGRSAPDPDPAGAAPLTLKEAVEASLRHFPTVRGSRADLRGAEADLTREHGAWLPDLNLRGSATRYQEPTIVYPIHSFGPDAFPPLNRTVFQGGAYLNYTLFDGGGRMKRVDEARDRVGAAEASLAGSESELVAQVAEKFLEVLSRRRTLDAHDRRLDALRSERDRVDRFMAAGRAARVDSLRVEAALAGAEAQRVQLAGDLAVSQRDLAGLTGILPPRTSAGNLVPVALADTALAPGDTLVARAFRANADVRRAERSAAAARAATGAAKSVRYPRLELTGGYQVWSDPDGNSSNEWNAAVQVTQTLFTGGEVAGRIRKAEAGRTAADEGVRLARITTRRAVLQAADRVRAADARVRSLAAAAGRYDEVARVEELALTAGTGTQTDYLTAEADLLAARAELAEARRAAAAARVELARLTGELDPGWLDTHLETER